MCHTIHNICVNSHTNNNNKHRGTTELPVLLFIQSHFLYNHTVLAKVLGSRADVFCSRAGNWDRQGFFIGIEATRGSQEGHQNPDALTREADEA